MQDCLDHYYRQRRVTLLLGILVVFSCLNQSPAQDASRGQASAAWTLSMQKGEGASRQLLQALRHSKDASTSTPQVILALGATGSRLVLPYLRHIIRDTRFGRTSVGVQNRAISLPSRQAAVVALAARRLYTWDSTLSDCILDDSAPRTLKSTAAAALCWQLVRDAESLRHSSKSSAFGAALPLNPLSDLTALRLHDSLEFAGSDLRRWIKLALYLTRPSSRAAPLEARSLLARLQFLKLRGLEQITPWERLAAVRHQIIPSPLRFNTEANSTAHLQGIQMANRALSPLTVIPGPLNFSAKNPDCIKIFGLMVESGNN